MMGKVTKRSGIKLTLTITKQVTMERIVVKEHLENNADFISHPDCRDILYMTINFYKKVGFEEPWVGYYVKENNQLVGSAAFKGRPVNGKVEIAYGTFSSHQNKGIGTSICRLLVELSIRTDPTVIITARTLPHESYSTRILVKNDFQLQGLVMDEEDGEVWEWQYYP